MLKCIWQTFLFARLNLPNELISIAKNFFRWRISFPVFWCTKSVKFHLRWGTKPRDQNQDTRNDYDVISGTQASRTTDFSDIFLCSDKQRTIIPLLSELISSHSTRKWLRNLRNLKLEVLKLRHNHYQCPVFGLAVLYPTGSEIWRFWYIKTRGRKIDRKSVV